MPVWWTFLLVLVFVLAFALPTSGIIGLLLVIAVVVTMVWSIVLVQRRRNG
jgi:hypothetical protein